MTEAEINAAFDAVSEFFPMVTSLFGTENIQAVVIIFAGVACFSLIALFFESILGFNRQ